jgi:hypothetical protein
MTTDQAQQIVDARHAQIDARNAQVPRDDKGRLPEKQAGAYRLFPTLQDRDYWRARLALGTIPPDEVAELEAALAE